MRRQSTVRASWRGSGAWLAGITVAAGLTLAGPSGAAASGDRCRVRAQGVAGGVQPDARTATDLICEQLRWASGGRGGYEITLAALGKSLFVTAARREPAASVSTQIDAIEEVPVAAERLAQALARGESFASTQRVGNLLEDETQPARSKKGSVKFFVSVSDVESPEHGARGFGFGIGLLYAAPRFALPVEMRFGWDNSEYPEPGLSLFSLSLGGRAFLSTRNVSPFVGGGLGILRVYAHEGEYPGYRDGESDYFDAQRSGVAPYLEVGVEALRLHRARIVLQARVDLPTGAMRSDEFPIYSYSDDWQTASVVESVRPAQSRYVVPVSIGVAVAF